MCNGLRFLRPLLIVSFLLSLSGMQFLAAQSGIASPEPLAALTEDKAEDKAEDTAAHNGGSEANEAEAGVAETLFEHILNSDRLSLFPYVPPIQLPFGMTVHLFMLLLSTLLIIAAFVAAARTHNLKPRGIALMVEMAIVFIRDDMIYPIMGEKRGKKWLPFFTSLFLLVLFMNLLGLIPAFKTATGNLSVTSALAIMILLLIFIIGIIRLGIFGFFKNFFPEGVPVPIGLFVSLLEFMSTLIKGLVLSLRLFANMFAGHLAILSFLVLMFLFSPAIGAVAVPFAIFTYTLEVLIGVIQAFVFTLLSCTFISMASTSHDSGHEEHE